MPISEVRILFGSSSPLSNIKNGSLYLVSWYVFGSTRAPSGFNGICGMLSYPLAFQMFHLIVAIEDKFATTFSEISHNCLPRICCTVSSVGFALYFMPTLIFFNSTCAGEFACIWSLTCSINSSVVESFTVARHCISFLQRIHSHKPLSFTSIFLNTYMYPSLTSFL